MNLLATANPYDLQAEKVVPAAPEAERAVLGALMLDKDAIIHIVDMLRGDDFYLDHHRYIYEAALSLFNTAVPIDSTSLSAELQRREQLQIVGGKETLLDLLHATPLATRITHYARYVKRASVMRRLIKVGQQISELGYRTDEELEILLEQAEKHVFSISQQFVQDRFVAMQEIFTGNMERIHALQEDPESAHANRVQTHFRDLDEMLNGGFAQSDLIILAARPSMGKTALALEVAMRAAMPPGAAQPKRRIGIVSLEMSKEQLVDRMICAKLGVDSWHLQRGRIDEQHFQKLNGLVTTMGQAPIYIDDSMGGSLPELRARVRRLQMEKGLDMLIIDYLQLMSSGNLNRVQEISEISRSLKLIARELHIPVIALSQLSRNVEQRPDKRPVMSDLRDSGSIEQDADVILMLYRESYYSDENEDNTLEVNVIKHRNGATGRAKIFYDRKLQAFGDLDKRKTPEVF
ncbi:replicative DNA helicase [Candidatus Peribacteria bacterium]|nr:replicative DNA helicase [Candidatus Peribacteria bacterium]